MKRIVIILFFAALIGTRFPIAPGVSWADFFCVPLFLFVIFNYRKLTIKSDSIALVSVGYSCLLLLSGVLNGTVTNTVFLNFSRFFIEGTVAYLALSLVLEDDKDHAFFTVLFYAFSVIFLILSSTALSSSMADQGRFETLDIQSGRNGMAVSNLLIIIMIAFLISCSRSKVEYLLLALFPFLVFNIIFSASRFSVISLGFFAIFYVVWIRKHVSKAGVFLIILAIVALPYFVNYLESRVNSAIMEYSSELLQNKITRIEDGGFAYRINDLNIAVIRQWLTDNPFYYWIFGDGISITHGVFSFTFCCTGIVGFLFFVISHLKLIFIYLRKSSVGFYVSFLIFIFFFNDIVANSRFIIGINTMLYMGMLAYLVSYDKYLTRKSF